MFQLVTPTHVKLKHINVRTETHGKEKVSAVDLDFVREASNSEVLDLLHPDLCEAMHHDPDADNGQETVPGVRRVLPKLRFPKLSTFPWVVEGSGMDLTVIYGLGDELSNIEFADGRATTKRVEQGDGTAAVFWRYSSNAVPDGAIDKLRKKLDQMVEVTLIQQERLRTDAVEGKGPAIDGTAAAFQADHPEAGDLFAAEHGGEGGEGSAGGDPDSDEEEDSEGGATDLEERLDNALARADAEPPPVVTRSTRTARGREKTKRALAEGAAS